MMHYGGFFGSSRYLTYFTYWHFFAVGVILIGVILFILGIMKNSNQTDSDSLDMLNDRFINGELTQDEYLRKKALLDKE